MKIKIFFTLLFLFLFLGCGGGDSASEQIEASQYSPPQPNVSNSSERPPSPPSI